MKTIKQLQEELEMLASGRAFLEEAKTTIEIPNNATNGDVIKAVFPNAEIIMPNEPTDEVTVDIRGISSFLYFDFKWWNTPYRRETE